MKAERGRRTGRRGSILLLSLFFMFVLFLMAVAFFRLLPTELHSAARSSQTIKAHYACDAGLREAVAWLRTQNRAIPESVLDSDFNDLNSAADDNPLDGQWSYTVNIEPNNPLLGIYDIVSVGLFRGRPLRELRATVQNETFARYAMFIDTWPADKYFAMSSNGIQGPFHTNGYFRLQAPSTGFWTDGQDPWVNGPLAEMTQADQLPVDENTLGVTGDGNQYYGGNVSGSDLGLVPYTDSGAPIDERYNRIINGGREKISKIPNIDLPSENTTLRLKAWDATGDETSIPSLSNGVYVNTEAGPNEPGGAVKGGVFVKGDAEVTLAITEGNGNHQKITFRQGSTTVPGSTETVWRRDVDQYRKRVTPDPVDVPIYGDCIETRTRTRDIIEYVPCTREETGRFPECGTETIMVEGDGGILTPVTRFKICTRTVDDTCPEVVGQETWEECVEREVIGYDSYQPPSYWVNDVDQDEPGAEFWRTRTVSADPDDDGAYAVTVEHENRIDNNTSVIEVNDANYQITGPDPSNPHLDGNGNPILVNGDPLTGPSDPRRTVGDGSTVVVIHDDEGMGEYTVLDGRTNGVVFGDNNFWDLKGVNKGAKYEDSEGNLAYRGRTIAVNIQAGRDIEIEEDILQYYDGSGVDADGQPLNDGNNRLRAGYASPTADHILGLIAQQIWIDVERDSDYFTGENALHVYAVLMAGRQRSDGSVDGGFGVRDNDMQFGDNLGDFNLYGGIIQAVAQDTQKGYVDAGKTSGFRLNLNYDAIAAQNLQDFPNTNTFDVLRYVERYLES